jgi:hypothetical protein
MKLKQGFRLWFFLPLALFSGCRINVTNIEYIGAYENTRWIQVIDDPARSAVRITNVGQNDAAIYGLKLNNGGFFMGPADILNEVYNMEDVTPGEPYEKKLWRFVVENRYHFDPYSSAAWQHDPVLFFNSIGFGYCDDAASVYSKLAAYAGYQSRVWYLSGHVVPEVNAQNRWQMLDPDLEVYYLRPDGSIAGVSELAADPTLITNPVNPILPPDNWAYNQAVADIYASTEDNSIDSENGIESSTQGFLIVLPLKASIVFPGIFTPEVRSESGSSVPEYANLKLVLPAGWQGPLPGGLVITSIRGIGNVIIDGAELPIGSPAVDAALNDRSRPITEISVASSLSDIEVIYLINRKRITLDYTNVIDLAASAQLLVSNEVLPEENQLR